MEPQIQRFENLNCLFPHKLIKEDSFFLPSILVLCVCVFFLYLNQVILFILQSMDISNPAALVNAELLHFYVGRRVRIVVQVVRSDGGVVIGKSTDEKQLVVKGSPPPAPHTTYVEVYGAEIWTNFGDAIGIVFPSHSSN